MNREKAKLKVLFVIYNGYQNNLVSFFPDNGLATLAAVLMKEGHDVRIKDFCTFDVMQQLYPYEYKEDLLKFRAELDLFALERTPGEIGFDTDEAKLLTKIRKLEEKIDDRNQIVLSKIGQELNQFVETYKPDCVGFKLWAYPAIQDQIYLAKELKRKHKDVMLIGGGWYVSMFRDNIYALTDVFDYLVYGPAEKTMMRIQDLVNHKKDMLKTIPNLIYKVQGNVVVNSGQDNAAFWENIPRESPLIYNADIYLAMKDDKNKLKVPCVEYSRGCSASCTYCPEATFSWGLKLKPVSILADELETLHVQYGYSYFYDAGPNTPFPHIVNTHKEIHKRGQLFGIYSYTSLREFDSKYITFLKQAHIDSLRIGFETGSDKLLNKINKNRNAEDMVKNVLLLQEAGINCVICVMNPLPGEDEIDRQETLSYIKQMRPSGINVHPPEIHVGTQWWSNEKDIVINHADRVMISLLNNGGMTWNPGNKVLPVVLRDECIGQEIIFNGRPLKETFYAHRKFLHSVHQTLQNPKSREKRVGIHGGRYNTELKYKKLVLRLEEAIDVACRTGDFQSAQPLIQEFNAISTCGRLC